jgi:hypothetical protein
VAKLYEDLSNDDLIDLLVSGSPLPAPAPTRIVVAGRASPSLAASLRFHQDASVGQQEARRLNPVASEPRDDGQYRPLDSVWYGEEDAELIEQLLRFYPHREPRLILDTTVNGRRFWRDSARLVIGLDIERRHRPDVCADNAAIPFRSASFDVVVYDPPHIPNQGHDRSKDFNTRFGLGARSPKENGYTFAHTYPAFMGEAWRVLIDGGVLLCKIADYVHNHRARSRVYGVRLHRQSAEGTDHRSKMEGRAPHPTTALLLDRLQEIQPLRMIKGRFAPVVA